MKTLLGLCLCLPLLAACGTKGALYHPEALKEKIAPSQQTSDKEEASKKKRAE